MVSDDNDTVIENEETREVKSDIFDEYIINFKCTQMLYRRSISKD